MLFVFPVQGFNTQESLQFVARAKVLQESTEGKEDEFSVLFSINPFDKDGNMRKGAEQVTFCIVKPASAL